MLRIELLPIAVADIEGASALIVTSRNALRALAASPALLGAVELPILTVGPGTAELARELGFTRVVAGAGSAADLVPLIANAPIPPGALIHLAGEILSADLTGPLAARDIKLRKVVAYRTIPANELGHRTRELLARHAIDAVTLMSPRTAATFARLVADAGLKLSAPKPIFVCLSAAVAAALGDLPQGRVVVAEAPNSEAMLAAMSQVATLSSGV
jgi:uroporphyrinogen-III synthase